MTADRWCRLAFVDVPPDGAIAVAGARDLDGGRTRTLAAWPRAGGERAGAVRVARHVIGREGPAMAVS